MRNKSHRLRGAQIRGYQALLAQEMRHLDGSSLRRQFHFIGQGFNTEVILVPQKTAAIPALVLEFHHKEAVSIVLFLTSNASNHLHHLEHLAQQSASFSHSPSSRVPSFFCPSTRLVCLALRHKALFHQLLALLIRFLNPDVAREVWDAQQIAIVAPTSHTPFIAHLRLYLPHIYSSTMFVTSNTLPQECAVVRMSWYQRCNRSASGVFCS